MTKKKKKTTRDPDKPTKSATRRVSQKVIKAAIDFINARIDAHKRAFAAEVGEHLFVHVYASDLEFFRDNGRNAAPSLTTISKNTGLTQRTLLQCIHYHVLTRQLRRYTRKPHVPDLKPWQWDRLWDLEGDPAKLRELAVWVEKRTVSQELLETTSRLVEPYILAGGRLEDLLVGEADQDAFFRLAQMVKDWIRDGRELSPEAIDRALAVIDEIEALLAAPRIRRSRRTR